ncbi:sugar ABC transporter ATP-binding protein [Hoeflea sp. BAL378]|uniref:sugar ABC transporter ATP-binding protein n=1 Tax=Hoeflea sp. BAL378 TaxID=1547437 RepID=UPI000512C80E|nr:sugar ABC transporter ATP-binding protein [Hoeflea sp. BAL378]KGF69377.1 sugar ABC transporter ATP-binding protein [Hoeflea sp. BAL378]
MPRLRLEGVCKRYGATVALGRGDLSLMPGEVHVLMGSNGSGKSTLSKIIAGSVRPDEGVIECDGSIVTIPSPRAARDLGIAVFYQELSLAAHRSVVENICLPGLGHARGLFRNRAEMTAAAEPFIEPFESVLGEGFGLDVPVGRLRADQRQLVEIMKTLAARPDILIFDEPTSALDRAQVECFMAVLRKLKADGKSIIFISHRMDEIFEIGDRVTIIRDGETVRTSVLADTTMEEILRTMTGEEATGPAAPAVSAAVKTPQRPTVKLKVSNLVAPGVNNVSFEVAAGEILGFGGLHGQGQSAALRALFGAAQSRSGDIEVGTTRLTGNSPRASIRNGLAYVSGDRARDGVIEGRSILENTVPIYALKNHLFVASPRSLGAKAQQALEQLQTKYQTLFHPINSLSGGNQQKVVVSRWLMAPPEVMLLDDPTKGIDIASKAELFRVLRELAAAGMAILLYSSEDAELLENSDRVLVFNNGRTVRELVGDERTRYHLYHAAYEAA